MSSSEQLNAGSPEVDLHTDSQTENLARVILVVFVWWSPDCLNMSAYSCKVTKESVDPLEMRWCFLSSLWPLRGQDVKQRGNTDESLFNSLLLCSDHFVYYSKYDVNLPEVIVINFVLCAKSLPKHFTLQGGVLLLLFYRNFYFHPKDFYFL